MSLIVMSGGAITSSNRVESGLVFDWAKENEGKMADIFSKCEKIVKTEVVNQNKRKRESKQCSINTILLFAFALIKFYLANKANYEGDLVDLLFSLDQRRAVANVLFHGNTHNEESNENAVADLTAITKKEKKSGYGKHGYSSCERRATIIMGVVSYFTKLIRLFTVDCRAFEELIYSRLNYVGISFPGY